MGEDPNSGLGRAKGTFGYTEEVSGADLSCFSSILGDISGKCLPNDKP
jgi:hypothetical protein